MVKSYIHFIIILISYLSISLYLFRKNILTFLIPTFQQKNVNNKNGVPMGGRIFAPQRKVWLCSLFSFFLYFLCCCFVWFDLKKKINCTCCLLWYPRLVCWHWLFFCESYPLISQQHPQYFAIKVRILCFAFPTAYNCIFLAWYCSFLFQKVR